MSVDASTIATSVVAHMERAWNLADGAAFAEVFAEDTDFVDIRGGHHCGRAAVDHGHQALFDSIYAGSTARYVLETAREAAPGCIVAITGATMEAPIGPLQGVNHARFTITLTEHGGIWKVTAFQNTLIKEAA